MKRYILLLILEFTIAGVFAQNQAKTDSHTGNQTIFIKIENSSSNNWIKNDQEVTAVSNSQSTDNGNVTFNTTNKGIYIQIINGINQIKLFALTGQLLLNGNLSQGRFFIPTRFGIYFLRINNESFKVVCK